MARKPNAVPPKSELDTGDIEDKKDDLPLVAEDDDDGTAALANGHDNAAVDDSVEALKERLAASEARAENEAAARKAAEARVAGAQTSLVDSHMQVISNAIGKTEADKTAIRAKLIAAKEAGDYTAEVDAQDELSALNVKLNRLNEGKTELERRMEESKEQAESDPVEQYVKPLQPKAQQWVRAHGELVTDPVRNAELNLAHQKATRQGLAQGSDAYFAFLETELGYGGVEQPPEREVTPAPQRQTRPPAAPPSRSSISPSAKLPNGVTQLSNGAYRLSPERREYARISGLTDAEYLKNLLELQREGQTLQ